MGNKYGTLICEVNGLLEIYLSAEHNYSIYIKQRSESGRRFKKLLKADIINEDEAMKYCQHMIDRMYDQMNN